MERPSEPLLALLRKLLHDRGMNASEAARGVGIKKSRMRRILSGADPMTVDELLQLSAVLELTPAELGIPDELEDAELPEPRSRDASPAVVDPWGNHARQIFEVAFGLGVDFGFECQTGMLDGSGVPDQVLERYRPGPMLIQLDSAFHSYNNPRYTDDGITIDLSFDSVYACTFPWESISRLVLQPAPPEDTGGPADEPERTTPLLRLVT